MPTKLVTRGEVERSIRSGQAPSIADDVVQRFGLPLYSHREADDACERHCYGGWTDASCHPNGPPPPKGRNRER